MNVEDQIEDNEDGGDNYAEPNDIPAAVEPKVLAVSIKVAWLWPVRKHMELPFAPVHAGHDRVRLTSGISLGPMSLLNHGFRTIDG